MDVEAGEKFLLSSHAFLICHNAIFNTAAFSDDDLDITFGIRYLYGSGIGSARSY